MRNKASAALERFNYLISAIDSAYHDVSQSLGMADSSMVVLYAACYNGGSCLVSDISGLTGMSKQTINSALRKLEREGIITLEQFGGKKKTVLLTEEGKALAAKTALRVINIENEIMGSWSNEDRDKYLELTQRYLNEFREKASSILSEEQL
ncbi:MAG: winged helix-turn-helix transcriptional regulator [Oscillospiraceae bacterium]|nr:winged helix-turn-helix transcriptional regulator [Oscillospiraceae bacterium]